MAQPIADDARSTIEEDDEFFTPRTTEQTIADIYGPNKTDQEYLELVDNEFLIDGDWHCTFFNSKGNWRVRRNPYNDRGEMGSIEDRAVSVDESGSCQANQSGRSRTNS